MEYLNDSHKRLMLHRVKSAHQVLFMLDFDGTLSPIASHPELARMSESLRITLEALAKSSRFSVSIISGRSVAQLKSLVRVKNLIYVGNHGLELEGPGFKYMHAQGKQFERVMKEIHAELEAFVRRFPGASLEDKGVSLSCHFRLLDSKRSGAFHEGFSKLLSRWVRDGTVHIVEAKKVYEVRPRIRWNKGSAVRWVLLHEDPSALPFYIGDDKPDEPAFKALAERGITVRVGFSPDSAAQYFVQDAAEVERLLTMFAERGS